MLGDLVADRADVVVWLDLPLSLVMWRLLRRTARRGTCDKTELWNGNVERAGDESLRYSDLARASQRAFANRARLSVRACRAPAT